MPPKMVTGFRIREISFVIISNIVKIVKYYFDFFAFFMAILFAR